MTAPTTYRTVNLYGDAVGAFWWPIGEPFVIGCTHCRVNDDETLRDAVLRWSQDYAGDSSEGIAFANARVTFTRETRWPDGRRVTRSRDYDLSRFPSVSDCICDLPDGF